MNEAGLPVGLYRNIFVAHQQVQRLLEDPRVSGLSFTGSEFVGRHLASIAGKNLKKQVLELGGNNALCVLKDADVSEAVEMAIPGPAGQCWAKLYCGQANVGPRIALRCILSGVDKRDERLQGSRSNGPFESAGTPGQRAGGNALGKAGGKCVEAGRETHRFFGPVQGLFLALHRQARTLANRNGRGRILRSRLLGFRLFEQR